MTVHYLYKITNVITNELYFGMTKNPSNRWSAHKCKTINTYTLIHKKIQEYGKENFKFDIIASGDKDYIKDLEEKTISKFNSLEPNGYNQLKGKKQTDLTKKRKKENTPKKYSKTTDPEDLKKTAKEYLMKYVKINEDTGCWEWQGPRQQPGKNPMHPKQLAYGLYHHKNDRGNAHRKSWEIHHGEIPEGMLVMHTCDVPYCCNPKHLVLGTHTANMRDKVAKGRCGKKGKPNPRKLNPELVREIRENRLGASISELALAYGVSYLSIKQIQDGISWKNV